MAMIYETQGTRMHLPAGRRGFALLIAVIFMAVMLTFGLALSSLAYKQVVLSSASIESQYAFYAADAALECTLYADQQLNQFAYPKWQTQNPPLPSLTCDGGTPVSERMTSYTQTEWTVVTRLALDSNQRCADVTVYKYSSPQTLSSGLKVTTYVFSQGYDVPCSQVGVSGVRFVSRGLEAHY